MATLGHTQIDQLKLGFVPLGWCMFVIVFCFLGKPKYSAWDPDQHTHTRPNNSVANGPQWFIHKVVRSLSMSATSTRAQETATLECEALVFHARVKGFKQFATHIQELSNHHLTTSLPDASAKTRAGQTKQLDALATGSVVSRQNLEIVSLGRSL